jgi:hypothetical protein
MFNNRSRGMSQKINNGLELGRQSWNAVRANPQLLMFPVISTIAIIVATILFIVPIATIFIASGGVPAGRSALGEPELSSSQQIIGAVLFFVYSFVCYAISIFSNVALVGAVMKIIRGEQATVRDGLNIAFARLGKILVYAFISATIGSIARAIRDSGRNSGIVGAILAAILAGIIQGAWSVIVFFAIPVIVAEDVSVIDSLKRSFALFKQTWGEGFTGSTAISFISCLVWVGIFAVGALIIGAAAATGSIALIVLAVALVVVALSILGLLTGAVNGVFQASLYHYATTGSAGPFIDTEMARDAFPVMR